VVLVCAPAGYGKTVLLADWARCGERQVAWLSLDAGDNDPARFWRHAVAALDRARPGVAGPVGPLLGPSAPLSFDTVKKHVTHILGKLGAANRTQAVARARALGLIP
jgi:LuxR family transcriptional regulator, maltose regulon positive regulatory protein